MINKLGWLAATLADRLADTVAPRRDDPAALLAEAEAEFEVYEPVGEYPDLPNVPAGVERAPLRGSTGGHPWQLVVDVADVIGGHRLIGVMCGCTTPFVTPDAHAQHVARLVLDAIK